MGSKTFAKEKETEKKKYQTSHLATITQPDHQLQ